MNFISVWVPSFKLGDYEVKFEGRVLVSGLCREI